MSESARQSYYEVALSNRQVLMVFVVLLLCVVVAFVAGVWVGRQGSLAPVETVEAQTISSGTEEEDQPLERLDFFSRDGEAEGSPAAEDTSPPVEPQPAPAEQPPAAVAQVDAPVEPAPQPQPMPAPAAEAPAAAPPAAPSPAPAAETASAGLVIQVFSSSSQDQARQVLDRLRSGGYPALLSPVEVSGQTMYRVRIGPYSDRQVAEGIADEVRREYRLETWITE